MTICPSKSAKKNAKKKAAAARKADFVERDEVEGFAPAGTNNHADHSPEANGATPADSSEMARKKSKNKESTKKVQTDPPEVPVAELFPRGIFPEGEWQSYQNEQVLMNYKAFLAAKCMCSRQHMSMVTAESHDCSSCYASSCTSY